MVGSRQSVNQGTLEIN